MGGGGARVSEFFLQESKAKKKIFLKGEGGGGERGLELVFFY